MEPSGNALADEVRHSVLERDREWIHPGDQLRIVGIEQGDNDFRSGTPALKSGVLETAQVDPDELRERKLAMYAGGASFDHSPRGSAYDRDEEESVEDALIKAQEEPEEQPFPWALPVGVGALALVAIRAWATGR